jgi:hypothetical protein
MSKRLRPAVARFSVTDAGRQALEHREPDIEPSRVLSSRERAHVAAAVEILTECLLDELEAAPAIARAAAELYAAVELHERTETFLAPLTRLTNRPPE